MDDLISRQAAMDAIPEVEADIFENCGRCELLTRADVVELLRRLPPAEPERKRGKWKKISNRNYRCPFCNASWIVGRHSTMRDFKYCANCGERVEIDEGDEE